MGNYGHQEFRVYCEAVHAFVKACRERREASPISNAEHSLCTAADVDAYAQVLSQEFQQVMRLQGMAKGLGLIQEEYEGVWQEAVARVNSGKSA
jgi:hypothetical protein